jgi:hypothetical protein
MEDSRETLLNLMQDEARRTPGALILALVSAVGTVASVIIALRSSSLPAVPGSISSQTANLASLNAGHYVIGVLTLIGAGVAGALIARFINAISPVSAFFSSVGLAILGIFATALVLQAYGVRFSSKTEDRTGDVVYWGTMLIYFAINSTGVFTKYRDFSLKTRGTSQDDSDGLGDLVMLAVLVLIWCGSVAAGKSMLTAGLLP